MRGGLFIAGCSITYAVGALATLYLIGFLDGKTGIETERATAALMTCMWPVTLVTLAAAIGICALIELCVVLYDEGKSRGERR